MARILANENFPLSSVRLLREAGHDVISVTETCPGEKDASVLELASEQKRILITFDRDYGELIYLRSLPCPSALILLRFDPMTPDEPAALVADLLATDLQGIIGCFIVLGRDHFRKRPLPNL
jgi:predicted nuclease of predicted toxin-antitoxin system